MEAPASSIIRNLIGFLLLRLRYGSTENLIVGLHLFDPPERVRVNQAEDFLKKFEAG
jgi:hypothetical protein